MGVLKSIRSVTSRVPFGIKIFASFTLVTLLTLILVYLFTNEGVLARFRDFVRESRISAVQNFVPLIESFLARGDAQGFFIAVRDITFRDRKLGENLVLAGPDGTIVAAVNSAYVGQVIEENKFREISPIRLRGEPWGRLMVAQGFEAPTQLDLAFLDAINHAIVVAGAIAALAGLGVALWLTRQITLPLRQLASATGKISQGELEQKVDIRSPDALGKLGDAFNTMSDKLSRSESLRRDMIADIAHELRTPMTLIQGNLQAILDGIYEPTKEKITSIHEKSLLLSRLIKDLQELSLAEAGELPLDRIEVNVQKLISHVAETIQSQMKEKNILLDQQLPIPEICASLDPSRISQVLLNLLSNAQRYTPEGGKITIKCWHDENNVLISVSDTGPGIPEKDLPNIFERFWRGDLSRTRASGGSGLGLAVAKQWVESHGGRIWVESPTGEGATFIFSLPLQATSVLDVVSTESD